MADRRRLQEIIKRWEEDNHAFADTCESLVRHFKERYNRFEGKLRILQGALSSDEIIPQDQREAGFELTITDKIAIFVTSPIWIPISLIILVVDAPKVGVMAIMSKLKDKGNDDEQGCFLERSIHRILELCYERSCAHELREGPTERCRSVFEAN